MIRSNSTRVFVLFPALILAEQLAFKRRVRVAYAPIAVWGYLQYRLAGRYRRRLGGGGPGMRIPPERLVTGGIYGWSRNPMYLGHLVFLTGLALATRSRLAVGLLLFHYAWSDRRVRRDEQRLEALFGQQYADYRRRVPRWLPRPAELARRTS